MKLLLVLVFLHNPHLSADTTTNTSEYFIAMEYKGISNCIYKVFITDSLIMCAKVNGYISVENGLGIGRTVLKSEMHDPEAYVDKNLNAKYTEPLPDIPKFLDSDRQNFIIRKKDIKKVYNNPAPKWGMGYYPYGGRIIIETTKKMYNSSRTTELILIGDQNPEEILAKINRH